MSDDAKLQAWRAWAARVELRLPFRVDIETEMDGDRVTLAVNMHVLERDTREPITVRTRRHVADAPDEFEPAIDVLRDLLETGWKHEIDESIRFDGVLVKDAHAR